MSARLAILLVVIVLTLSSLGGSIGCGGGPAGVTPTPPPVPTYTVTGVVFLDDNGNGVQDGSEPAIVPNAVVEIDGRTGTSLVGTGGVTVAGVRAGTYNVNLKQLPTFYQAVGTKTITVPQTQALLVPVTVPIGDNIPGLYLSQGDSISEGVPGSHDKKGWRSILQDKLRSAIVRAKIDYRGTEGGTSDDGAASWRVDHDMRVIHPAFTIIDWGVNDWNIHPQCDDPNSDECPTIPNLQHIIEVVKAANSQPCLATLTPPNTALDAQARYDWVIAMNKRIRDLAKSEGVLLIDVGDAFVKAGNPPSLFYDHLHPNDAGYALMADTFYAALTGGGSTSSVGSPLSAFSLFKTGLR